MGGIAPGNDLYSMLASIVALARHKLVYVASPYTHYPAGMDQAYVDVCEACWWLNAAGVDHYSPIIYTHPLAAVWGVDRADTSFWLGFDKGMIDTCDALLVVKMDGWTESDGVAYEIAEFAEAGKPIYLLDPVTLRVTDESN